MLKQFLTFILFPVFSLIGAENCRFEAICSILDLYERPVSVLAIGENADETAFQIADRYPATCVVAKSKELNRELNNHQVIYLKKKITTEDLRDLNKREHFDIILAFRVLENAENWQQFEYEIFRLGDNVIIETPFENTEVASSNPATFMITRHLTNMGLAVSLGSIENSHLLWYCFKPKSVWKNLYLNSRYAGISLLSFYHHEGRFPSKSWIRKQKANLPVWKRYLKNMIRLDLEGLH